MILIILIIIIIMMMIILKRIVIVVLMILIDRQRGQTPAGLGGGRVRKIGVENPSIL